MSQQFYKHILCSKEVYYGIRSVQPLLAPCQNYKHIILYYTHLQEEIQFCFKLILQLL